MSILSASGNHSSNAELLEHFGNRWERHNLTMISYENGQRLEAMKHVLYHVACFAWHIWQVPSFYLFNLQYMTCFRGTFCEQISVKGMKFGATN